MEVAGKGEGGDKSQLIKAISAEQGLVQNLNQPIIQPPEKKRVFLRVRCSSDICSRWVALPSAAMRAALWVTSEKMNSHCVITAWTSSAPLLMSDVGTSGVSPRYQTCHNL